jgi:hypothetical protein
MVHAKDAKVTWMEEIKIGSPGLARVMGPHGSIAMFKQFSELNTHNLLYLQAELVDLEQQLKIITYLDEESGDPIRVAHQRDTLALKGSVASSEKKQ